MKRLFILSLITVAFNTAAEVNKPLDLTAHRINELEQNFIGQDVDIYSMEQVESTVNAYDEYLLLCSGGLAKDKCAQAKKGYPVLKKVLTQHIEYKHKLQNIRDKSGTKAAPSETSTTNPGQDANFLDKLEFLFAKEDSLNNVKILVPKSSTGRYERSGPTHSSGSVCSLKKGSTIELTGEEQSTKVLVRYHALAGINSGVMCEPNTMIWLDKAVLQSWE